MTPDELRERHTLKRFQFDRWKSYIFKNWEKNRCVFCTFFEQKNPPYWTCSESLHNCAVEGWCKRFPPSLTIHVGTIEELSYWPTVDGSYWCGEFRNCSDYLVTKNPHRLWLEEDEE